LQLANNFKSFTVTSLPKPLNSNSSTILKNETPIYDQDLQITMPGFLVGSATGSVKNNGSE
jgi:hypothetical protein